MTTRHPRARRTRRTASPPALAVVGTGALALAVLLARGVAGRKAGRMDVAVRGRVLRARHPALDGAAAAIRLLGYPVTYVPIAALVARDFRRRGARAPGAVVGAAMMGWAAHRAMKLVVRRDRPPSQATRGNAKVSYPSGHTTGLTAVTLAATHVADRARLAPRPALAAIAAVVPLLVGASRVYRDEHWTTDAVGGVLTGLGVAALVAAESERRGGR